MEYCRKGAISKVQSKEDFESKFPQVQFEYRDWDVSQPVDAFFENDSGEGLVEHLFKDYFALSKWFNMGTEASLYPWLASFLVNFLILSTKPEDYELNVIDITELTGHALIIYITELHQLGTYQVFIVT